MSSCYCDYDMPAFSCREIRTARKPHQCEECGIRIMPGQRYEYISGKWADYISSVKVCEACHDLRMWVSNNVPCFCWAFGHMHEDAQEAIAEAQYRAPAETVGLWFGFSEAAHSDQTRCRAAKEAA